MPILLSSSCQVVSLIIVLFILAIISWRRPVWGVCLVVFCLPLYLLKVRIGCLPSNVLELMIGVVFLVWVVRGRIREVGVFPSRGFWARLAPLGGGGESGGVLISSVLILAGLCLAILFSDNQEMGAGILKSWFLAPMALALLAVSALKSKKQLKFLLAVLALSGAAVAAVALGYFFQGKLTFDGRLAAFYLSPNHLAMYLAPIFILGFGLWPGLKNFWQKLALFLAQAMIFVAIYLTFSYGAWIGIIVALVFLVGSYHRERFSMVFARRFILILGLAAILFLSQLGTEKFENLIGFERSSVQSRLMVWKAALAIAKDNPVFGIGPGMFQEKYLAYQEKFAVPYLEWAVPQPHNLFLAFWLQAGMIGLIGLLGLIGLFFKKSFALVKSQPMARILIAAMIYIIIHGLIDTTYWKNDLAIIFWLIIAMVMALGRLSRMESAGAKF